MDWIKLEEMLDHARARKEDTQAEVAELTEDILYSIYLIIKTEQQK